MSKIVHVKSVDSTNIRAKEYPFESIIVADEQSRGRGRFNRVWQSSSGGLWLSIVVKPIRKPCEYTFVASLAVHDSLDIKTDVKWPNDLYYKSKKLCGILTEVVSSGSQIEKIIVGIGINVNNSPPIEGISLKQIKKKEIELQVLLSKIVNNFWRIDKMQLSTIIRLYKEKCTMLGKAVKVQTLTEEITGFATDIDEEGNLLIQTKNGIKKACEGEASIL